VAHTGSGPAFCCQSRTGALKSPPEGTVLVGCRAEKEDAGVPSIIGLGRRDLRWQELGGRVISSASETTVVVPNFALVLARDKGQDARVYNSLASSRGPVDPCLCSGPDRLDCSSVLLGNLYSGSGCERFRFAFLHQVRKYCREYVPIFTIMDNLSESSSLNFHAGFL